MPQLVGWDDDGTRPLLALEDLSDADWEVRWDAERSTRCATRSPSSRRSAPPPGTRPARELLRRPLRALADRRRRPGAVPLGSGCATRRGSIGCCPTVLAAAETAPVDGDALCHLDVRSDNLCFRDGRALLRRLELVLAREPRLDVAAWLPSVASKAARSPGRSFPAPAELAAFIAGVWAAVAGLPPPETAPERARRSSGLSSPSRSTGSTASSSQRSWSANGSSSCACRPISPASIAAFTSRASCQRLATPAPGSSTVDTRRDDRAPLVQLDVDGRQLATCR